MRAIIGLFQILGGLLGAGVFSVSIFLFGLGPFIIIPFIILSILAGYFLIIKNKHGKTLTLINQGLQVIQIKVFGILFYYYSGLGINLTLGLAEFGIFKL